MPALSDTKIRSAKPRDRRYKLFDTNGLFLIVHPNGGRWWRQRYEWNGKEHAISLGTYPEVSLATARANAQAIRIQVANGVNPSLDRLEQKVEKRGASANTYQVIALEWLELTSKARMWTEDHKERVRRRFEVHFFPWLGPMPIRDVTDDAFLECLHRIETRNLIDTAHRALAENDWLFRYAKKRKYVTHNVLAELRGPDTLPRVKRKHHSGLKDPKQVGPLLVAIDHYHGSFVTRSALRLQPLVFARPGTELRLAKWSEFDLERREWRIPAERMKMREYHIVPVSKQAIGILRELHPLTGPDGFVFPQVRNASRPISENTLNVALRACGYSKDQQTAHGFRTTASTLLNENGWNRDAIERQLAHGERDESRGSYNGAEYLPERRTMMQWYSDYLDSLKLGNIPLAAGQSPQQMASPPLPAARVG